MPRKVYNPTDGFAGFRFQHGKAQTHQIEETFDPENWEFVTGETGVIRAGAAILINDKLLIAHTDFSEGDAVELAVGDGVYEGPASVAIGEFASVYVAETDDGGDPANVTGVALRAASNSSVGGLAMESISEAGTLTFRHILAV